MSDELKPCPFCGSKAHVGIDDGGQFPQRYIDCENNCTFLGCTDEKTWNTRPIEDALQQEIDRQREINKTIAHDIQKGAKEGYKQLEDALRAKLEIAKEACGKATNLLEALRMDSGVGGILPPVVKDLYKSVEEDLQEVLQKLEEK